MDPTLDKVYRMTREEVAAARRKFMAVMPSLGPTMVSGEGTRIQDADGRTYIDCTSQAWTVYLGFGNEEIQQVICQQAQRLTHLRVETESLPRLHLAHRLAELAPQGLDRVSFTVGGGPAVEAAMKIAIRNRPGAKEFISLWDAYHGSLFSAASLSWIATQASGSFTGQQHFLPMLHSVHRVPNPYCYRCPFVQEPESCDLMCAEMLRHTLQRGVNGPAAGFILEPIQGSGGQIPAPRRYLERVREICDEFEVPLIFDEIQTFCRIGEWFAADYYGVTPDIIAVAKGIGGGLPIAAVIVRDTLEGFSFEAEEIHTFANNSLCQAAAIKMLEIIERDGILENTRLVGAYLAEGLRELQEEFPEMGDIRAVGLHIGIEYVEDPETKEPAVEKCIAIREEALRLGAIFGLGGAHQNVLKIKPPLIMTREEADEALDILRQAMQEVLR
ncbi:MAG: aspartate aminotransferase family protein [bacterium]